jgi:hypothetical protein
MDVINVKTFPRECESVGLAELEIEGTSLTLDDLFEFCDSALHA